MIRNQLTQAEAQRLFDYRDGMLYWRQAGSGRRPDRRAVIYSADRVQINIGGRKVDANYAVWNWHHGVTEKAVRFKDGDRRNISIDNLREEDFIGTASAPSRTVCPCCSQRVPVPILDVIAFNSGLQPLEKKVLRAVWDGKGMPVQTARIIDAMYGDDEDGGPEQNRAYQNMKIAMTRLRGKLNGTGIGVVNCGYGAGYRLVMGAVE